MRAAIVIVGLLVAGVAAAEPRVAVEGNDRAGVTKAVRSAIDEHAELVDRADADAIVSVDVKAGKKWKAVVVARGADGTVLARYEVKAKKGKLAKATARKAWKQLGKALKKTETVPEGAAVAVADPEPEPEPAKVEEPEPRSGTGTGTVRETATIAATASAPTERAPWIELAADGRPFWRTLRYNDDIREQLRSYDLAAPAVGVSAVVRPVRFVAVHGEVELAVGVNGSRASDGTQYPTSASEWSAGVRGELPVGAMRWAVGAAYGEQRFTIEDEGMPAELVPDVTYRYVRGGVGLCVPLTPALTFDGGAGYRYLRSTGELESTAWFPRTTGAGVDAEVGAAWHVGGPVSVHARADVRRYFFAMNPQVGDALVVGGAVDQYLSLVTGLTVSLR